MAVEQISKKKTLIADVTLDPQMEIQADMAELLIDLAYRITLLELGVSE